MTRVFYDLELEGLSKSKVLPSSDEFDVATCCTLADIGGFQLEFVSISRVINHMTCYKPSSLIG
jgi:hypothetical protein